MNDDELSFDRVIKYTITAIGTTTATINCPTGVKAVLVVVGADINLDPAVVTLTTFATGDKESITFNVDPITDLDPNFTLNPSAFASIPNISHLEDDSFPTAVLGGGYQKFYPIPITGYSVTYADIVSSNTTIYLLL